MATEAQINANRQNSERSTGPRTDEGKAVVSQNAVKHGLFADANLIAGESATNYGLVRDVFLAEMKPVGAIEFMLFERFMSLTWRLQRAELMHTESIDHLVIHAFNKDEIRRSLLSPQTRQGLAESGILDRDLRLGRAVVRDFAIYKTLDKLMIYERRIESSMHKTMTKLKQLQSLRRTEREKAVEEQPAPQMSPPANLSGRLKIQTQMGKEIMAVNAFTEQCYEHIARLDAAKIKANQSQVEGTAPDTWAGNGACRTAPGD